MVTELNDKWERRYRETKERYEVFSEDRLKFIRTIRTLSRPSLPKKIHDFERRLKRYWFRRFVHLYNVCLEFVLLFSPFAIGEAFQEECGVADGPKRT